MSPTLVNPPPAPDDLFHAAIIGEDVARLVEIAAEAILRSTGAHRVGIWISDQAEAGKLSGTVVERDGRPASRDWCRLDVSASPGSALFGSSGPTVMPVEAQDRPQIASLLGLSTAVWIPVGFVEERLGLCLVGFAPEPREVYIASAIQVLEQFALLYSHRQSREHIAQLENKEALRNEINRALVCDANPTAMLDRILQSSCSRTGASFALVARETAGTLSVESYAGPPPVDAVFLHPVVERAIRNALEQKTPVWINGASLSRFPVPLIAPAALVALPVLDGETVRAVFCAGFSRQAHREHAEQLLSHIVLPGLLFGLRACEAASESALAVSLRRSEAETRAVLDSIDSAVLILDAGRRIRFLNSRFLQTFGLEERSRAAITDIEVLIRKTRACFLDPERQAERWRDFSRGEQPSIEEIELCQPARRVLERFARPIQDFDGRILGWLEVYRDLTPERQAQTKIVQMEKLATLGQLVSGMAHEINNPLTSIQGYAQLVLSRPSESVPRHAELILQEAARAGQIVRNVLQFARQAQPEAQLVDLNEVVERTLALREYELKTRGITVILDLERPAPRARGDFNQFQQILLNLLLNAEQALERGRGYGHVRIRTCRVAGQRVALEVADDGPGIPREHHSRIFDPFFTTKPPGTGTGLGLSIVYGLVRRHQGDILFESVPGEGTTFSLEFPLAGDEAPQAVPVPPAAMPLRPAAPHSRILIVEDESTVAQLVADVLREDGHDVEVMLDSYEALRRINHEEFDLVICDLKMPRLDGRAFHAALVRNNNPASNRFLMITGDVLAARTVEFLEQTELPYLAKPFLVEELRETVRHMLDPDREAAKPLLPRLVPRPAASFGK